ncbi:MAG TPA: hypothetical protein VGP93_12900 [Polyangiaceae bacterium]|nr:hypothetical protein [Polyangiaceae bacterium]
MSERNDLREATARVLDPNEVEGVLSTSFYTSKPERTVRAADPAGKPTHYKVICISMYTEDLARLDEMVDALKARGLTKANRSALIRYALGTVKPEEVPKGM